MAEATPQDRTAAVRPLYRRRWFRWLVILLLLLGLILALLPVAVRYAAVKILQDQGIQEVAIDDVDLNLFTGTAGLTGVSLSGDGQGRARLERLQVNLALTALLSKQLQVQELVLQGLELDVQQGDDGQWVVAGITPPAAAESEAPATEEPPAEPWAVVVDSLRLAEIRVHLQLPQLQTDLRLAQLQLDHLSSAQPQQPAAYQLQLYIDEAPLSLAGQLRPFAETPSVDGRLTLQQFPLALADGFARAAEVTDLKGELAFSSDFQARLDGDAPVVESTNEIALSGLQLKQGQYALQLQGLTWQGEVDYLPPSGESDLGVRAEGTLKLQQFALDDTAAELQLARLARLDLGPMVLAEAQRLDIEGIGFQGLTLLQQGEQRMLELAGIDIDQVAFDGQQHLAIDAISLNGLAADLRRQADGQIALLDKLLAQQASETGGEDAEQEADQATGTEVTADGAPTSPWRIQLGRFHIAEDSRIRFQDQSVDPFFESLIKPLTLNVSDIDTGVPDQAIQVDMRAVIDGHEEITLQASVQPFGESLDMEAEGKITALELPPLSPYANQAAGYYLKRGRLDASLNMKVVQDQLDARIHLNLKKFNIAEGDPAKHKGLSERLSMPLDAALGLLRDKQDNIELDLDIAGDIDDPQFDISKVINKAIADATVKGATTYVKFMLQPWGAMWMAAEYLGKSGGVRLEPMDFVAGSTDLKTDQREYLDKLAALLQERPEISLNICGQVSEQDRQALIAAQTEPQSEAAPAPAEDKEGGEAPAPVEVPNDQLLALARQRGEWVKQQLIQRGVEGGRLFGCQPSIEGADKNAPQVKLFL